MVRWIMSVTLVLVAWSPSAVAQAITEVPQGSSFRVQNGTECLPNTEVDLALRASDGLVRDLGTTIADGNGHFEFEAAVAAAAPLGAAEITASCGLNEQVLVFDVEIVPQPEEGLSEYLPLALIAIGVLVVFGLLWAWRARTESDDDIPADDAPTVSPDALTELAETKPDEEDDPDYWIWDAVTSRGEVKRMACLSAVGFYLHEVPADDFNALLEELAQVGPDLTLSSAFFSAPVTAIDEVHHRGSQLRVVYHDNGQRVAQVIDLGSEVDGVVDLLSRRVQVLAAAPTRG